MGIQINGQTDTITATDGSFTLGGTVTAKVAATTDGVTVATGATISGSTNTIIASTNGSERVRITSSGNVGIGTDNPYSNASFNTLSVGGSGKYGLIELVKSNGVAGSWIDSYGTSGDGNLRFTTAGTSGAITFWTGGEFTEKVRVGAAGSVGIATTSPQTKLHIHNAGWVDNIVGTGGLLLSSVDTVGPGIAFRQKEGYYWNLYHGSTSAWAAKGNFGFTWSDGINAASGLSAGITTAGYIVGNRNIIQVVDATTATRVNGAGPFTAITSSSIKCTTNKTRFMISVTCPVNISDDSDAAANANSNPYFYGVVERNLNGAGWVTCGGQGSSSQGGVNAHIELSPNRTGNNGTTDYWSGNRYRMEHKYAHFFDDEISPGSNQTIQFRLRILFHGGDNWIQIGEPQGYGADDNYPCQRWGMMIYELGPDASFTMVNTAP